MMPVRNLLAICMAAGLLAFSRGAASVELSRDIPAQPLAQALGEFTAQTGLQFAYVSEIAAGKVSTPVARGLPAAEALEQLLAGTGLHFELLNDRTVRILARPECSETPGCAEPGAASLAVGQPARGRSPADPPESALEEIVVTARRREERLLEVPISLSVLPGIALEHLQIDEVGGLQYTTPNMTVTPWPGTPVRTTIAMRGQVEPDRFPTVDPAVGVYLDGVYVARMGGANLALIDMERVEVLRGPQGTLFGRNTIGGAINLLPKKPDANRTGMVTAGAGNYDHRELEAIVNLPLGGDRYAVRVAASHIEHSGYGHNTFLGLGLNEDDSRFVRAQLRLGPGQRWDINFSFDYTRNRADLGLVTLLAASPIANFFPVVAGNPDDRLEYYVDPTARRVQANRGQTGESEIWGASGVLEIELGNLAIKALSSYRALETDDGEKDLDGTPYDILAITARAEDQDQWNHEIQSYGEAFGGRLGWIGGLHFFSENAAFLEHFHVGDSTTLSSIELRPTGTARNESAAAYAQLAYAVSPTLQVTGGIRYNEDRRQLISTNSLAVDGLERCTLAPGLRDAPGLCRATLPDRTFSYVPWTIGVDLTPLPDVLLYAKASRGYRAGGYNFRALTGTDADTFAPEQVTAWEVGARAELLDRRLRFGLSLYRSLFDDAQVRTQVLLPDGQTTVALTQNAGEARIDGGELEVEALLGLLKVTAALGVTTGRFTWLDPQVLDVTLASPLLYTPESTVSFAASLPVRTTFGEIDLHAAWAWRDDQEFAYWESQARRDAYGVLNAMVIVRFDGSRFTLQLWGRNLTDRRYIDRSVDLGLLVNAVPGDPRTYGVSLSYRFDSSGPGTN